MSCSQFSCSPVWLYCAAAARSRPSPIGAATMAQLGSGGSASKARGPSQSTWHRIFKGIDQRALEYALSDWAAAVVSRLGTHRPPLQGLAIDGKTLCGSERQGAASAHLLSCISQSLGIVLAQVAVQDKTNEIAQVGELLAGLVLDGKVITGDALLTQRHICEGIRARGGHYLFAVKENQPQLREDVKLSFLDVWWLRDTIREGG